MESDWKQFNALIPKLKERYLAERNRNIVSILQDANKSETERFWDAEEEIAKQVKILRGCFGDHSRSKMLLSLIRMRAAGIVTRKDAVNFSEFLQNEVFDREDKN
jgi:hypothetical protein